eukprot:5458303-Prorocentrum_lima.AAC.1
MCSYASFFAALPGAGEGRGRDTRHSVPNGAGEGEGEEEAAVEELCGSVPSPTLSWMASTVFP